MEGIYISKVEVMDTMEEHFHLMNHRPEVDNEREPDGLVFVRHWTRDAAARRR
jgi:hypothetical protein